MSADQPRLAILNPSLLEAGRARLKAGDPAAVAALKRLCEQADKALTAGPFSVMDKDVTPPSGDKHDYMSLSVYWWPNPDTPDGLPYVNRDGEINPEVKKYDGPRMGAMAGTVYTLALGYYFTGEEKYAERAAYLLRVWFLDEATRMNPNLNYGQGVPGREPGNWWGIIETGSLARRVVDAVGLLAGSKAWTAADQHGIEAWFAAYLRWLRESPHGKMENAALNNHGVWYDVQVASFAILTGDRALARRTLKQSVPRRIAQQIQPDGRQPLELARTKSFSYSLYNLDAFLSLGELGDKLAVDVWHVAGPDGQTIRSALDYLVPFAAEGKKWEYKQITPLEPGSLAPLMRRAALGYDDPAYEKLIARVPGAEAALAAAYADLLWPWTAADSPAAKD